MKPKHSTTAGEENKVAPLSSGQSIVSTEWESGALFGISWAINNFSEIIIAQKYGSELSIGKLLKIALTPLGTGEEDKV